MRGFKFTILGVEISFRADADPIELEKAKCYVEELAQQLKSGGNQPNRDKLLMVLALGVAYDLLQTKNKLEDVEARLERLFNNIDESV